MKSQVVLSKQSPQLGKRHLEVMDELESMAVVSRAEVLDADTSRLLSTMNARIKALEEKLEG